MQKNDESSERTLGERIADSKPFSKNFNDPAWDWLTQRWKGTIIRDKTQGCNYYDFSGLRPILIHELHKPILDGLKGDLSELKKLIKDIDANLSLRCGDLLQIGKTKNRGLFLVSTDKLLPITQLLGGNGFGEIPLNFLSDISSPECQFVYRCDYWTFQDHPIISHVPYISADDSKDTHNIRIGGQLFTLSEGSDCLKHPHVYLDFDNNEYFTLPKGIKERFNTEIERIINSYVTGEYKQSLEVPAYVKPEVDPTETASKSKSKAKPRSKAVWSKNRWTKKKEIPEEKQISPIIAVEKPLILKKTIPALPPILPILPKAILGPISNTGNQLALPNKPKIVLNIKLKQKGE